MSRRAAWRPELLVLLALAAVTRFWGIGYPDAVVFDEAPYEHYASHYLTGTYYFNLHPPVGKLLLAAGARLIGISPATLAAPDPATLLRLLPALAGTLVIPVFWLLLRQLGAPRSVAAIGASLLLFDNALLTISRLVLIDSLLLLFILGTVTAWLASQRRSGTGRWWFVALSALLAGLAVGTKWTGLAALGLVLADWAARWIAEPTERPTRLRELGLLTVVPALVYAGAFAVHFALLPAAPTETATLSAEFKETLVGVPVHADTGASFPARLADIHRAMVAGNTEYDGATHDGASPWWSWPILKHPLYLWAGEAQADGRKGHLFIEGNPVLWWGILIALGALGVAVGAAPRLRARLLAHRRALLILLGGWLINFVPFVFVGRILFLYSYFPAMVFSLALATLGIAVLTGWMRDEAPSSRRAIALAGGVLAAVLASFLYFAPLSYGTAITTASFDRRMSLLERDR